jgi:hypothetical protein
MSKKVRKEPRAKRMPHVTFDISRSVEMCLCNERLR